jgi:hypothetical protein
MSKELSEYDKKRSNYPNHKTEGSKGFHPGTESQGHDQKRSDCPNHRTEDSKGHDHRFDGHNHGHDHRVCQKLKAENECFKNSVRQRFGSILKQWNIGSLKDKIIEIIELILKGSLGYQELDQGFKSSTSTRTSVPKSEESSESCLEIRKINDFNKIQFYKINFFIESLEKSKISPIHIHRMRIFLQNGIFDSLPIKDFFEQMISVEPLYSCAICSLSSPVDAELSEITKYFYTHMTDKCKECYIKESITLYTHSKKTKNLNKELNVLRAPAPVSYTHLRAHETG